MAGPAQSAGDELARRDQLLQVDAMGNAQAVEEIDQILAGDIARRAFGIGAAAQAGNRTVDRGNTALQRGVDIGNRLAIGIVKMHRQF